MLMTELIAKKRDGGALTTRRSAIFITGYVRGDIPDYQVSALLMAMYFPPASPTRRRSRSRWP
jgi:pyrimidine-nucleoside phosphorylase